jgi:hypothetical protein
MTAAVAAAMGVALLPAVGAHAGLEPVPPGFKAQQVSAVSNSQWWVLGTVPGCAGHRCNAIAHTTNGGVSFSLEFTSAQPHGTPRKATTLRMAADGVHGWILAPSRAVGYQLWRTSNSALTWTRVPLARKLSVLDVGGGKVWVAGRSNGRARAWSASAVATSATAFTQRLNVPTVSVSGSPALVALSRGKAEVLSFRPSDRHVRAYVVSASGFTATNGPSWCDSSLGFGQVSASHGTTWVDCPTGMADAYGYSMGGGIGWHHGPTVGGGGSRIAVGGIDATHAAVSPQGSGKLRRVSTSGAVAVAHVPTLASGSTFGFIGFTSRLLGFAVVDSGPDRGKLLKTADGGHHWHTVTI